MLVPALSFIASASAITRLGAKPVFVDINSHNALLDLNDAEKKISSLTKAILFIDLYGNLPNFDVIEKFAKSHNLFLIEDAAQAFGCEKNNRKAGSMGDVSIFSFDPTKPVGAFGTGGAILTNNENIAKYCFAARQNGKNHETGEYDQFGINSRISESQAALIKWQIDNFPQTLSIRQEKARYFIEKLKNAPIDIMVKEQLNYSANFHKFVISCKDRNGLKAFLKEKQIETRIHYKECMYQHPVLKEYASVCPNAEILTQNVLSLPFYPELEITEIDYISDCVKSFCNTI